MRNATPTSASTRTSIEPVSPLSMRSDTVPNANCGAIWPSVINDTSTIPAAISHLNRRTTSHPPTAWSAMAASSGTGGRSVVTSTDSRSWRATLVKEGGMSADSSTASRAAGMCSATSSTAATITCSAGGGNCTTRSAMPCGNRRRVMSSTAVLGACARRRAKISSSSDGFTALRASSSTSTRGGDTNARAERDALALPARQGEAAVAEHAAETAVEPVDHVVGRGGGERGAQHGFVAVTAEEQVLGEGVGEEERLLADDADGVAHVVGVELGEVDAVDAHVAPARAG